MSRLFNVVGYGSGALDIYPPLDDVCPRHVPSIKLSLGSEEFYRIAGHRLKHLESDKFQEMANAYELHIGGNIPNVLMGLACEEAVAKATFVGILGEDDIASQAIKKYLGDIEKLSDGTITVPGYLPSISVIERRRGTDRMLIGRARHALDPHLTEEHIAATAVDADLIVISSLKSPGLAERVFRNTPDNVRRSYNPGSVEFDKHAPDLLRVMQTYPLDMLTLNNTELRQLYQDDATRIENLALRATRLASYVLCTLGESGVMLAYNGQTERQPAQFVPPYQIVDSNGAGDRAHAVAAHGLLLTQGAPEAVLAKVTLSTAEVIQHIGPHGDLYPQGVRHYFATN